ncbi:SDR family oxidoreductase [Deinococcus aerophilus]|uniref:NAD(P)-dependent oxidoreductase n=1 Tax=Deinococcus aerophilus TaxID=522488 RepID=A0ABQ2GZS2_9DEIO|nr:SDR family oxidoreductase [Deinococcus aerophilus]GGM22065.1 NAD(P)-dependent oxidoreductase [Deinococcus aerophilus]
MTHHDDPRTPEPAIPPQHQDNPGTEAGLEPAADHGETSYHGSGKLKGKVALITGADSGIGKAVAIAFAREGADVVISYLSEDRDAEDTARLVREAGRQALTIAGDIGDPAHCQKLVERTVAEFGALDVLVNNVAYQNSFKDLGDVTPQELERHYRTNVFAIFYLCQSALPHLKPGASIINTSSVQAYQPSPNILAYASTKGAVVTMTKGLAKMLAEHGIRVNSVAPGPIWTPLVVQGDADSAPEFGQNTPLGRPGQPAELAATYVLLASGDSAYTTGAIYAITGGELTA